MPARTWLLIKQILGDALEQSELPQREFVRRACKGDLELEQEVLALLAQPTDTVSFDIQTPTKVDWEAGNYWLGRNLGPYRVEKEIPGGGMSRVFEARRVDGEYDTVVVIKILRACIDSLDGRERFNAERQILARLRHPRIASILDGGTVDGLPYFVMEFVDGVPVDRHCSSRSLSIEARLKLFSKICEAVEYAHQQLIVHRDIKPDNILVNASGDPKLLDFGIAKLIGNEDSQVKGGLTHFTGVGPYTPAYAAPEQLRGEPISTATDVYALSCVLYQILTGQLPFNSESNGLEAFRVKCDETPKRPSVRVLSTKAGNNDVEIAGTPDAVAKALKGDLDLIVMKGLEKEVSMRYQSVAELRADIDRFLAGRAIDARPHKFSYLLGKFLRRNRIAASIAALAGVATMAGVAGVAWQAHIAQKMRVQAEERLEDVSLLTHKMIFDYNAQIVDLPGGLPVSKLLMGDISALLEKLSDGAGLPVSMRLELAMVYARLATAQGTFREHSLGEMDKAAISRAKAYQMMNQLLKESDNKVNLLPAYSEDERIATRHKLLLQLVNIEREQAKEDVRLANFNVARTRYLRISTLLEQANAINPIPFDQANGLNDLAQFYAHHDGDYIRALDVTTKVEKAMVAELQKNPNDDPSRELLAIVLVAKGLYLQDGIGDHDGARKAFLAGISEDRRRRTAQPDNTRITVQLASDLFRLGSLDMYDKDFSSAKSSFEEAHATLAPLLRSDGNNLYLIYVNGIVWQADVMLSILNGHLPAARKAVAEMRRISEQLLKADSKSYDHRYFLAQTEVKTAMLYLAENNIPKARAYMVRNEEALGEIANVDQGMRRRLIGARLEYAEMLLSERHWDEVIAYLDNLEMTLPAASDSARLFVRRSSARRHLALAKAYAAKARQPVAAGDASLLKLSRDHFSRAQAELAPIVDSGKASLLDRQRLRQATAGVAAP
ncbi:serine/threonine protein kinase [Rugamonas aquatica]|nr:serine/threonine-protein kinase [Rugamonas aquatica]